MNIGPDEVYEKTERLVSLLRADGYEQWAEELYSAMCGHASSSEALGEILTELDKIEKARLAVGGSTGSLTTWS